MYSKPPPAEVVSHLGSGLCSSRPMYDLVPGLWPEEAMEDG